MHRTKLSKESENYHPTTVKLLLQLSKPEKFYLQERYSLVLQSTYVINQHYLNKPSKKCLIYTKPANLIPKAYENLSIQFLIFVIVCTKLMDATYFRDYAKFQRTKLMVTFLLSNNNWTNFNFILFQYIYIYMFL